MKLDHLKPNKVLDTRGLRSPLPAMKMIHALRSLSSGKTLEVWCADPDFQNDFNELCESEYTRILEKRNDPDGYVRYIFQKK